MQAKPNPAHGSRARRQSPKLRVVVGGLDLGAFEAGRQAAALANVAGYTAALAALHPNDVKTRQWYRARLDDARTIAGLEPLTGGHLVAVD